MPDSVMSAVRSYLVDSWGEIGARVFRDTAPARVTFPYSTFFELPETAALSGDGHITTWDRGGQISLWQQRRGEDRGLVTGLINALDGAHIPGFGSVIYGCHVTSNARIVDPDGDVVQDALTIRLIHDGIAH